MVPVLSGGQDQVQGSPAGLLQAQQLLQHSYVDTNEYIIGVYIFSILTQKIEMLRHFTLFLMQFFFSPFPTS